MCLRNFGKALILMAIGSIIGVFAQSIFIQRVDPSWRVVFLISVIIFGVVVVLLTIFAPETNHGNILLFCLIPPLQQSPLSLNPWSIRAICCLF